MDGSVTKTTAAVTGAANNPIMSGQLSPAIISEIFPSIIEFDHGLLKQISDKPARYTITHWNALVLYVPSLGEIWVSTLSPGINSKVLPITVDNSIIIRYRLIIYGINKNPRSLEVFKSVWLNSDNFTPLLVRWNQIKTTLWIPLSWTYYTASDAMDPEERIALSVLYAGFS